MNSNVSAVPAGAGFLERFLAMLIDAVILVIPSAIIQFILPDILSFIVGVALGIGYVVYFWTTTGSTPGKMVMKLKVVNAQTGELLDPGTAVLRYVGYFVSALPLYLGFIWVAFDENKEGFHDKIAKTRVIKTS